jgi:entry exclusion lipoprotein TrbK
MKTWLVSLCAVLVAASLATASEEKSEKSSSPQAERMRVCSKEAADKGLKGEDRRHFMSECLRSHHEGDKKS